MTDQRPRPTSRSAGPSRRPIAGTARRRGSTTWSRPASGGSSATTRIFATFIGIHTEDAPPGQRRARRGARRDRRATGPTSPRSRRSTRPACRPRPGSSATSRCTTSGATCSTPRSSPDLGAALDRPRRRRRSRCSLLFARDFAPLAERLDAIASRLEAAPAFLEAAREPGGRAPGPAVADDRARDGRRDLPAFFDEIVAAGEGVLPAAEQRRLRGGRRRGQGGRGRLRGLARGHAGAAGPTTGRSGASATTSSSRLRAFDGLDADAILAIGEEQLAMHKRGARRGGRARSTRARPRRRSSTASRPTTRRRSRRRSTATATSMVRARAAPHRARHRDGPRGRADRGHPDARVPAQRDPVRGLLRRRRSSTSRAGIYIVTPSVDDDPDAMREHNSLDQQHQHPRGLSGPPPAAVGRRRAPAA